MIYINEDNANFYCSRMPEQITKDEITSIVDYYSSFPDVKGVKFCTNLQRALFDSQVWETLWQDYDPDGPDDQPCLAWLPEDERTLTWGKQGRLWLHNLLLLKQRGLDHFALWLKRCREQNIEGWLTVRMNDVHYNDTPEAFHHCKLWKERPDLWRVNYKNESWWDRAFDYGKQEVREHHLSLIRELLERYDMDGIELDWIRSIYHFAPGGEEAGLAILNDFVREVRTLVDAAAKRCGHAIKLAVRIPENPETCLKFGMDAITWIKESLVDQIVLSQWLASTDFDSPIQLWRSFTGGQDIEIIQNLSTSLMPFSKARERKGRINPTVDCLKGAATTVYHKGADGVYLFNYCYFTTRKKEQLDAILSSIGALDKSKNNTRRHIISFREIFAPGECENSILPQRFDDFAGIGRYGNTITLPINIGPAPDNNQQATVLIGFAGDEETPATSDEISVRVNGTLCEYVPNAPLPDIMPELADPCLAFQIPPETLNIGHNSIECSSTTNVGSIIWAEISINTK